MVGLTGFEPVTLRLSSACSNQLSYRPSNHVSTALSRGLRGGDCPGMPHYPGGKVPEEVFLCKLFGALRTRSD
jgi:hypothetical protein